MNFPCQASGYRNGTPDQVADAVAGELEEQFEEIRAGQLAKCREMS